MNMSDTPAGSSIVLYKKHHFWTQRSESKPSLTTHLWDLGHSHYLSSGSVVKNLLSMQETWETQVQSLGWEDPLEKEMATHSSVLAWRIPLTR